VRLRLRLIHSLVERRSSAQGWDKGGGRRRE
jgi:hypothetical protein